MFDKLMKDKNAEFDVQRDGPRFVQAILEYEDPVELLYRMTNPRVSCQGSTMIDTTCAAAQVPLAPLAVMLPALPTILACMKQLLALLVSAYGGRAEGNQGVLASSMSSISHLAYLSFLPFSYSHTQQGDLLWHGNLCSIRAHGCM
jgi:hypothetical protein